MRTGLKESRGKSVLRSVLSASLVIGLSAGANAGEKVDEIRDADPSGIVQIEHNSGKAKIIAWDKPQVSVSGELGDDTTEFTFEREGQSVLILVEAEAEGSWGGWGKGSIDGDDLLIYVPRQSRIQYEAVNASVNIEGAQGGSQIELVNGDIDAKDLGGKIDLQTVNGSIDAQQMQGALNIETVNGSVEFTQQSTERFKGGSVNGDIRGSSSAQEVFVETVNGNIEFVLEQANTLSVQTVNGDAEVAASLTQAAVIDMHSVGGSIKLRLPKNVNARFDIEAHAGGNIRNNLSDASVQEAEYGPRKWLTFSMGEASAAVDIATVNGSIILEEKN